MQEPGTLCSADPQKPMDSAHLEETEDDDEELRNPKPGSLEARKALSMSISRRGAPPLYLRVVNLSGVDMHLLLDPEGRGASL